MDIHGELRLSGNPGLSASIKDDLEVITGKPIIVPIYRKVTGSGNTAEFVIVRFVGVRIMAVSLTGKDRFVSVQPADVSYSGTVQASPGLSDTSDRIYSPPVLVK